MSAFSTEMMRGLYITLKNRRMSQALPDQAGYKALPENRLDSVSKKGLFEKDKGAITEN